MSNSKYTIAILGGSGHEGSGLALRLAHAGHSVIIGSRTADKAQNAANDINSKLGRDFVTGADNPSATQVSDIVILTVPHSAQQSTVDSVREELKRKILVDATVPLVPPKVSHVRLPPGGSAVASIQESLGDETRVVSAFQNVSAHHLGDLNHPIECDVLVCGNDIDARQTVINLIKDIGLRGLHAGPITNSAGAEALTSILIFINIRYKIPSAGIRITGLDDSK